MSEHLQRRRELRTNSTDAELRLWKHLRAKRFAELKWRRQHHIGAFIVDFYCHARQLIVEVDGSQHYEGDGRLYDEERTTYLEALGLRVLRFTNIEVLTNTAGVFEIIWQAVGGDEILSPPSPPSP